MRDVSEFQFQHRQELWKQYLQGQEEGSSSTQTPILILGEITSQAQEEPQLNAALVAFAVRTHILGPFSWFSLQLPWRVSDLNKSKWVCDFPSPTRGSAQEEIYSCPCGQAALQTVSIGKVTRWYAAKQLSSSGQNVFGPSSGAEALKLNVTDVKGWQEACWACKRAWVGDEKDADGNKKEFIFWAKGVFKDKKNRTLASKLPCLYHRTHPTCPILFFLMCILISGLCTESLHTFNSCLKGPLESILSIH